MKIAQVKVANFRGIAEGLIQLDGHSVLVGDNNVGKSTLLEAIDLVMGPERLSRRPVVDEHDFYAGGYVDAQGQPVAIVIEVVVTDLSAEQQRHFREHLEWWNTGTRKLLDGPPAEGTDADDVSAALRVFFKGAYDADEDDFTGGTFFAVPQQQDGSCQTFKTPDKRLCGFLYLRTLRTGARALSLERGSLLDVILRLQDNRLKMWEALLGELRKLPVADKPELGVAPLLEAVQESVRRFVPSDWADQPHMRVSDLTRETLRKSLTVFMATGAKTSDGAAYSAPYHHQGTGTINTLVLALLSIIAELKQNVIFAMEEPEIALPPHTQKRIVNSVRQKSAQAIFTSHSPFVLEEFEPKEVRVLRRTDGKLTETPASYPPTVKPKAYRKEFRTRFCEALLAKYVLVVEGQTEFDALQSAARRLHELEPKTYKTLEALGVALVDAQTDKQVAPLGKFFRGLGKTVFAVFDKQDAETLATIKSASDYPFESPEKGFENVALKHSPASALKRFAVATVAAGDWPQHLAHKSVTEESTAEQVAAALADYFKWGKGSGVVADFFGSCSAAEIPELVRETLKSIADVVEPPEPPVSAEAALDDTDDL